MLKRGFIRFLIIILLLLLIFYLADLLNIIRTIRAVLAIILLPVLFGGFLYYLLRPMVRFLADKLRFKVLAIIITFLLLVFLTSMITYFGGSIIKNEVENLIGVFNNYYDRLMENQESNLLGQWVLPLLQKFNIQEKLTSYAGNAVNIIRNNLQGLFSTLTSIGTVIILIVVFLFFFLKDDEKFYQDLINFFPREIQKRVEEIILNIDDTLVRYIGGQLIVALILGLLTYIGYLIIGLPNALILALIATVLSFIPIIGPVLGIVPAVLIALSTDLFLIIKVLIVMIIVQQLEGNVLQPKIQGDRMEIHPLMVIFMIILFVTVFGFLGALFAVPVYAIARVLSREFSLKERLFTRLI